MSSIVHKRILELSVQENIKLYLLCMSHCKYKVSTQQNQVILGPALHAELQKGRRKKNICSLSLYHSQVASFINEGLLLSGTFCYLPFVVMSEYYTLYDPAHHEVKV